MFSLPILTGLTATGTVQADALLLTSSNNNVTTVATGTGVRLPVPLTGTVITVINSGANNLLVYPQTGSTIGLLGVNAPYTVIAASPATFISNNGFFWSISSESVQSIDPGSHPTFAGLTLSGLGAGAVLSSSAGVLSSSSSPTLVGLTLSGLSAGVVSSSTAGVLSSSSSPTVSGLTISGLTAGLVSSSSAGVLSSSSTPTVTSLSFTGSPTSMSVYREVINLSPAPSLTFGGTATGLTYTAQQTDFMRLGHMVFFYIRIIVNAKGSSTGAAVVAGLPYSVNNNTPKYWHAAFGGLSSASRCGIVAVSDGTTSMNLQQLTVGGGLVSIGDAATDANFTNNCTLYIEGMYTTTDAV